MGALKLQVTISLPVDMITICFQGSAIHYRTIENFVNASKSEVPVHIAVVISFIYRLQAEHEVYPVL